jgi:hypothetical protein
MVAQSDRFWEVYVRETKIGECMASPNERHAFGLFCGPGSGGTGGTKASRAVKSGGAVRWFIEPSRIRL